jgi:hypothetical protein
MIGTGPLVEPRFTLLLYSGIQRRVTRVRFARLTFEA